MLRTVLYKCAISELLYKDCTDCRIRPLESGSCFSDMSLITFHGPGAISLNTNLMHMYVSYGFQVAVSKGDRTNTFRQQFIVKEGDPPDFLIKYFLSLLPILISFFVCALYFAMML